MWSENSKTNSIIVALLFLFAMGFMNKASYIIVLIAFILILKDNMWLQFKDPFSFSILILFAMLYFVFATQINITAGLRAIGCPVAFYIGSNMKGKSVENAKRCILVVSFGMAMHIVINFIYEYIRFGGVASSVAIHYDVWSGLYTAATGAMTNGVMLVGCICYLLFHENRKKIKYLGLCLLIITLIYGIMIGSRTIFVILLISVLVGVVTTLVFANDFIKAISQSIKIFAVILILVMLLGFVYFVFQEEIINFLNNSYLIHRLKYFINRKESIFSTGRWEIRTEYYKQLLKHPWGGRKLYDSIGTYAHELWIDIWDVAGVLPTILMTIFTVRSLLRIGKNIVARDTMLSDRVLLSCYTACLFAQFFVEPVLSGAPILIYSYCMIDGALAKQPS